MIETSVRQIHQAFQRMNTALDVSFVDPKPLDQGMTPSLFVVSGLEALWGHVDEVYTIQPCISLGRDGMGTARSGYFSALSQLVQPRRIRVDSLMQMVLSVIGTRADDVRVVYPAGVDDWTHLFSTYHCEPDKPLPFYMGAPDPVGFYYRGQVRLARDWITVATMIPITYPGHAPKLETSVQAERLLRIREQRGRTCDIDLYAPVRGICWDWLGCDDPPIIDCLRTVAAIIAHTTVQPGGKGRRHTLRSLIRMIYRKRKRAWIPLSHDAAETLCESVHAETKEAKRLALCINVEMTRYV